MRIPIQSVRLANKVALFAIVLGAASMQPMHAVAQQRIALPVDEASRDASFESFRSQLIDAVVRRDVDFIVSQASPDVKLSFGGHAGRKDLRSFLTLSKADLADEFKHEAAERREDYWAALEDVLRMGGRFTKPDEFNAPYTWTVDLSDTDDAFTTYFVVGDDVPVRNRASKYGEVIAKLSHSIVTSLEGGQGTPFIRIKLASGSSGFVEKSKVRSAVDYRAIFVKRGERWQLDVFIAGD